MTTQPQPIAEVTLRAFEVLFRELGPVDALRFMNQFEGRNGDYTAERDDLFSNATLEEMVAVIKSGRAREPKNE